MSRETTAPSLESWVNSPDACCFGLYLKWCFIFYFVWKLTFFTFTRRLYKDQTWQSYLKMIYFSRMIVSWKQDQEHNFVGIYITCFCIWEGGSKLFQWYKIVHTTCNLFVHVPLFQKNITGETKVLHYIPLGPLLFTGSGQFREKTLVGFYTKSSSMSDNSIYDRYGIGLDNPTWTDRKWK